jgi:hypothetical protein
MGHVGESLKRKLGPLPVWGWALIAGIVLYVVRNRPGTSSGGGGLLGGLLGGTSTGDGSGSSTGTLSDGAAGGGLGDNSALESQLSTLEQRVAKQAGTITKLRNRLRKKKKTKHHHHPRPKHHAKAARRAQVLVPSRKPRRNRTTVTSQTHKHVVKPRPHFAAQQAVPEIGGLRPASSRSDGRTGDHELGLGARTHFGGFGSAAANRARPTVPPAPGRNLRARPMGGPSQQMVEHHEAAAPARSSTRAPAPRHQPAAPKGRKR